MKVSRKEKAIKLAALIGLSVFNWRIALFVVLYILLNDWLFELEDKQADRDEKRYYHYLQQLEAEKRRDERIGKFMEEEW